MLYAHTRDMVLKSVCEVKLLQRVCGASWAYSPFSPGAMAPSWGWAVVKANLALSREVKPHQEVQDVGEELVFAQHLRQGSGSPQSSTGSWLQWFTSQKRCPEPCWGCQMGFPAYCIAVGPLSPSQQLPGESLCPLLCPTGCPSCFLGSGECVCLCICVTEDVVSCLWSWSMSGREALVTCGKDDISLPCWALSNFNTG